jgi:ABC-type branched-subunit amino acid transport system substrate-binding protein
MQTLRLALSLACISFIVSCSEKKAAEPTAPTETPEAPAKAATPETIKIGQTMPYSGPASAYSTIGRVQAAYFDKVNGEGGIQGRKLELLSLDDAYSPPKTVEQVRKLVEQDHVLFIYGSVGTATNSAVHKYLNAKQVPQLFVSTGATKWGDPKNFPWTIGFNPTYQLEGQTYAKHILEHHPKAKIAVLYQNDDYGKDLLKGLKDGLGDKTSMIVKEVTYEVSDPTIDSQIATLQASKATVFVDITTPKFAAQAVRRIYDSGWKPVHYLNQVGASIAAVLKPAGIEKAVGALTIGYYKDPTDEQYDNDAAMQRYKQFMKTYYSAGDLTDGINAYAYMSAQAMVQVLKQCGTDLTPENVMRQATNLRDFAPELVLPGITMNTSATDFFTFDQVQISRFDGKSWKAGSAPIKIAGIKTD